MHTYACLYALYVPDLQKPRAITLLYSVCSKPCLQHKSRILIFFKLQC